VARGDSEIRVSITGDAKSLTGALNKADGAIGRTAKNLAVGAVALVGVHETTHSGSRSSWATCPGS